MTVHFNLILRIKRRKRKWKGLSQEEWKKPLKEWKLQDKENKLKNKYIIEGMLIQNSNNMKCLIKK